MKNIFLLTGIIAVIALTPSCSKNEVMDYSGSDMVHFYERYLYLGYDERRTEELVYSFAVKPSSLAEDNVNVKVRLQGRISNVDRAIKVGYIADSTTAVEGVHFRLNDGLIKAGEYEGTVPVTVLRTADMKQQSFRIKLKIEKNEWFDTGVVEDSYIAIMVNDILTKPTNWPQWYGFGTYSANKYKFVIDVLGITDFPVANRYQTEPIEGIYTAAQLFGFAYQLQKAYEEYRNTHGPIYMDDNADPKVEISFN